MGGDISRQVGRRQGGIGAIRGRDSGIGQDQREAEEELSDLKYGVQLEQADLAFGRIRAEMGGSSPIGAGHSSLAASSFTLAQDGT